MNAMDGPMFKALIETADELRRPGLRAVVLSGNGPAWCAGLDFSGFQSMAGGGESNTSSIGEMENDRITHNAQQAVWGWRELPVPVIAAVHGVAFGAGSSSPPAATSASSPLTFACPSSRSAGASAPI